MKRVALITGASKGIGEAIAKTLAQDGFTIILHYFKDKKNAYLIKKEIESKNGKVHLVQGDLSKEKDIKKIFSTIGKITERLDLLVNNAGVYFSYFIEEYPLNKVREIFDVNFYAIFAITQLSLPYLKKSGNSQIINMSSRLGKEKVVDKSSAYAASKAAVLQFTKCCALEFRDYKIRVNAVCPGFTNTDINKILIKNKNDLEKLSNKIPLGRIAEPQDIANVISFLASDKASYINGESIGVNGGSILI